MAGFLLERVRKMVERGVEKIKAKEAVQIGLLQAVLNGDCKVECQVEIEKGEIKIKQRPTYFEDATGKLRVVEFSDESEVIAFFAIFYLDDDEEVPELKDESLAEIVEKIMRRENVHRRTDGGDGDSYRLID